MRKSWFQWSRLPQSQSTTKINFTVNFPIAFPTFNSTSLSRLRNSPSDYNQPDNHIFGCSIIDLQNNYARINVSARSSTPMCYTMIMIGY